MRRNISLLYPSIIVLIVAAIYGMTRDIEVSGISGAVAAIIFGFLIGLVPDSFLLKE